MKRYVFFDKKTGEILHTHQVFKMGSEKPRAVSKKKLALLANRLVDPKRIRHTTVSDAPRSSHKVIRSIDPKFGKLVTKSAPKDYWQKKRTGENSSPAKGGR